MERRSMTASIISRAANDPQLQARVVALTNKEIVYDQTGELADSWFGRQVLGGFANWIPLYWSVAVAGEAEYETAVNSGRGAPGFDIDIITDGEITSAIIARWPQNPNTAPAVPVATAPNTTEVVA
jgi:hypothetical protein